MKYKNVHTVVSLHGERDRETLGNLFYKGTTGPVREDSTLVD